MSYSIGAILVIVALIAVGFAYVIDWMGKNRDDGLPSLQTAGPTVIKSIAGQRLAIPPSWFRFGEQRDDVFADKIDLIFALPLGPNAAMVEVDVTLQPRTRARPSALLLDTVYLHLFLPQQLEGPVGLIGKPLRAQDGFQGETVWYDPVSQNPFVAKCMQPLEGDAHTQCMRTVLVGNDITATYVFDAAILQKWRDFDPAVERWLNRIGGI